MKKNICCGILEEVEFVLEQGMSQIALEATEMGKTLYEKYGFVKMEDEMELV